MPSSPPPSDLNNRSPRTTTPKAAPAIAGSRWRRYRNPASRPRKPMADKPGTDDLAASLDALRQAGAAERDPVRLAYIEALSRRATAQPAAIRQPLQARLAAQIDELTARLVACPDSTATTGPETANTPLADLLVYIGQHNHDLPDASQPLTNVATVNRT